MNMKTTQILHSPPTHRLSPFAVVGAFCLLASALVNAAGAEVYRWVDEQGKVHYSEVVPQRYQGVAKRIDAPANEPSAEQRRDALARAQQEKAKAAQMASERIAERERLTPASTPTTVAAPQPTGKRPVQTPNDQTDCTTWQRLYLESIECFGPFRTVGGGIKPGAFEVCNVVAEPPPSRCRVFIP
jgi:hypothetical protein